MKIELLGFVGCPNTPALRENLVAAIEQIDGAPAFAEVDQNALAEDDPRRGWPAPSILVDGRDLFGMPSPTGVAAGCRIYHGGVPDTGEIVARLRPLELSGGGLAESRPISRLRLVPPLRTA